MKRFLAVPLVVLAVGAAPSAPIAVPPPPPPIFHHLTEGFVSSKFHPRRNGNRVFYAGSLKASRPWLPFAVTSVHFPASYFKQEGLLAIFYRELPRGRPIVDGVEYSASDRTAIDVHVTISPVCGDICLPSIWDPSARQEGAGWGRFVLVAIDKSFLPAAPKQILVTESVYEPPPPPPPCVPPPGASICPPPPPPLAPNRSN